MFLVLKLKITSHLKTSMQGLPFSFASLPSPLFPVLADVPPTHPNSGCSANTLWLSTEPAFLLGAESSWENKLYVWVSLGCFGHSVVTQRGGGFSHPGPAEVACDMAEGFCHSC
jgi:hypothetical protein